jgi:hypothetical protein
MAELHNLAKYVNGKGHFPHELIYDCTDEIALDAQYKYSVYGPYSRTTRTLPTEICEFYKADNTFNPDSMYLMNCFSIMERNSKKIAGCISFVPFMHNKDVLFVYIFL